jgi:hypothetical protein
MSDPQRYTLFSGARRIASGDLRTVALAAQDALNNETGPILIFSDLSGRPVDLDLRGSPSALSKRFADSTAPHAKAGRGRPKLGVVAREVTLLPRHWDWLATQPGGASAALRRLLDQARRDSVGSDRRREAQEAAHRVMTALAGDCADYEEALRALYAGDELRFRDLIQSWPADVRAYVETFTEGAWVSSL